MSKSSGMVPRRYTIVRHMTLEAALNWDSRLADELNRCDPKLNQCAALFDLLEEGVIAKEEKRLATGEKAGKDIAIGRELKALEAIAAQQRQLEKIYEYKGLDEFVTWCGTNGIDWATFLQEYDLTRQAKPKTKSEQYLNFLDQYMRSGGQFTTDEIHQAAENAGLVCNDSDWQLMRTVASRNGYSVIFGKWQHPALVQHCDAVTV